MVYFEQVNGFYIALQRNHIPLYFATFAFTFSGLAFCIVMFAYMHFKYLRCKEYKIWSKQKKCDIDLSEIEMKSFIYY